MSAAHTRTVALRGVAVLTATLVLAAMVGTWGASTAEATSYRFWAYWLGSDTGWSFSNQGASRRPADGTVEGWRFAVSEASSSTTPPRHSTSFAQICGSTSPQDGKKRVGLVVDFGSTTDAPKGETPPARIATCVLAPTDANGYAVLAAAVQLRTDGGLICGMNGYPASECGVAVADPTTSPSASPTQGGGGGSGGSAGGGGGGGSSDPSSATTPSAQTDDVASDDKGDSKKKTDKSSTKKNESKKAETDPGDDQATAAPAAVSPAAASTPSTAGGSPLGLLAGLGVVVGLLAAAFVVRRRRT